MSELHLTETELEIILAALQLHEGGEEKRRVMRKIAHAMAMEGKETT